MFISVKRLDRKSKLEPNQWSEKGLVRSSTRNRDMNGENLAWELYFGGPHHFALGPITFLSGQTAKNRKIVIREGRNVKFKIYVT